MRNAVSSIDSPTAYEFDVITLSYIDTLTLTHSSEGLCVIPSVPDELR